MKHEEEVFQPLLMEYFTFEELREIKTRVLHLHAEFREVHGTYLCVRFEEGS